MRKQTGTFGPLCAFVFVVAAYLCVVNLDYAALWHDEAPAALIGRNLLEQGDIVGWDGRNLVGGKNGRTLNQDLRDVLPPLMYVLNAAGLALFGVNEVGARIMHAFVGILALGSFFLLLRHRLADHPRLVSFVFLFAALSPQLLLFFRQSRYYAFMVFGLATAFYLYERYWLTRKTIYLAALALVTVLSIFNHYTAGAATALSLATWHLVCRVRETEGRQWLAFAACGLLVTAFGLSYLAWIGALGGGRSGFLSFSGVTDIGQYQGTAPLVLLRIWIYTRELFTADWISWPVSLWFAGILLLRFIRGARVARSEKARTLRRSKRPRQTSPAVRHCQDLTERADEAALPLPEASGFVLMGALFALFSAVLSVQPVWAFPYADLRYYVAALPMFLVMKGLFAEWAWRKSKIAGTLVVIVLLFSSAGAAPFNVNMWWSGKSTLGLHLFQFIREIHRPYRDSIRLVSDFLLRYAEQDDLVYVPGFANREALTFSIGHHVLFCCHLEASAVLPVERVEALGTWLNQRGNVADWIVAFRKIDEERWARLFPDYRIAAELDVHPYPTQRPEITLHAFDPLSTGEVVTILRREAAR